MTLLNGSIYRWFLMQNMTKHLIVCLILIKSVLIVLAPLRFNLPLFSYVLFPVYFLYLSLWC